MRALTLSERLCLHQLPLSMDSLLAGLNSGGSLPFEDLPSPGVYTLFFCKLWGTSGGDLHDRPNGNHNVVLDDALLNHGKEVVEDVETREEDGTRIEVTDVEVVEDGKAIEDVEVVGAVEHDETAPDLCGTLQTEDDSVMALTVASWPDMSSNAARGKGAGSETVWKLDINFVAGRDNNTQLMDADTITSCASEETICRFLRERDGNGTPLEEHELGPSPTKNPGPPFKVGDVILCNILGNFGGMDPKVSWLQQGFLMEADHPCYKIQMEKGATVWTNMRESWLKAQWATGPGTQFADNKDHPFADLRANPNLKIGSYGIHIDAQHNALAKIVEAKAFAKAIKADNAAVPVYLWNNRVKTPSSITKAQKEKALEILRKLCHRWFLRRLLWDCLAYIRGIHSIK